MSSELFRPVTTRAAFEAVVRQIVGLIQAGRLDEGDVLPGERVLANVMQVSRPTIRLAINALAKEGLVEVRPGRAGGIVLSSRWVPPQLEEDWSVELGVDELFELLEARRTLEPRVAQLAAMRGTAAEFDAMRETLALQKAHLHDRPKAIQAELMFHRQMWHAARNSELEAMLSGLFRRMSTVLDMAMRTRADQQAALELNQAMLDVIARGDSRAVEKAMGEHMAYLERIAEETFGRSRIRAVPAFLIDSAD